MTSKCCGSSKVAGVGSTSSLRCKAVSLPDPCASRTRLLVHHTHRCGLEREEAVRYDEERREVLGGGSLTKATRSHIGSMWTHNIGTDDIVDWLK